MVALSVFWGITALLATSTVDGRILRKRNCSFTWPAYAGDTCATFADSWSITEVEFISFNPGVICDALEVGKEYCIEWSGTPPQLPPATTASLAITTSAVVTSSSAVATTSSAPGSSPTPTNSCKTTPAGVTTPSPIQTGLVCGCTRFYGVVSGDGCWAIANSNSIALEDFYAWNPAIGTDCKNLFPGNYVCVAQVSSTTPSATPTPTSTEPWVMPLPCYFDPEKGQYICPTAPPSTQLPTTTRHPTSTTTILYPPPGPTQTGIPANCNKWVLQKTGVYCFDMAASASITLARLYALNPALGGDCSGLWPGYAYCIGTV